jgi:hypothetical protein
MNILTLHWTVGARQALLCPVDVAARQPAIHPAKSLSGVALVTA